MGVSVRKKGSSWYIFIRHKGERIAHKCSNEQHAIDTQKAVATAIAAGQFDIAALKTARTATKKEEPTVPTLKEYYKDTALPLWEASLSRATYQSYEGSFRIHILPVIGDIALSGITRDRVKKFVASLRTKPVAKSTDGKLRLLSKETIRNITAALRACLSEAVESNLIPANPALKLGKFYKEAADFHEEIDPFTADEVSQLLETVREKYGFENYVLLLTLFHCGLRAGESAGLYWSDLDVRNRTLLVRRQFSRGRKGKPKTRKKRAVDLSAALLAELQALKKLKKLRQEEYLARGNNEIPEYIFLGPGVLLKDKKRGDREPWDMNNWRNRIYWKACDAAKIRRRRLHDTRHTFASLLLSNGESLKYVSSQLGHASIRMTADVYGHLEIGSNRAAMDRLPTLKNTAQQTQAATV
jgi:integrase